MHKVIGRSLAAALLVGVLTMPAVASAAANPAGTGQPSQGCLSSTAPSEPGASASAPGSAFNENGGISGGVYAGSPGTPSAANGSATAVSQYDVACYQVSQSH